MMAEILGFRMVEPSGIEPLTSTMPLSTVRGKGPIVTGTEAVNLENEAGTKATFGPIRSQVATDDELQAAMAAEVFEDEDDWRARPPSGAGFFIYCPIRFLAYLERFGPKPGEGKPPLLPPHMREMSEEQHARMVDRGYPEYTYFARGKLTGRIKIGFSTQPEYRICQLQHCRNGESAEELLILRGNLEKAYHNVFWRWHEGNEWFSPHPDILAEIERLSK